MGHRKGQNLEKSLNSFRKLKWERHGQKLIKSRWKGRTNSGCTNLHYKIKQQWHRETKIQKTQQNNKVNKINTTRAATTEENNVWMASASQASGCEGLTPTCSGQMEGSMWSKMAEEDNGEARRWTGLAEDDRSTFQKIISVKQR